MIEKIYLDLKFHDSSFKKNDVVVQLKYLLKQQKINLISNNRISQNKNVLIFENFYHTTEARDYVKKLKKKRNKIILILTEYTGEMFGKKTFNNFFNVNYWKFALATFLFNIYSYLFIGKLISTKNIFFFTLLIIFLSLNKTFLLFIALILVIIFLFEKKIRTFFKKFNYDILKINYFYKRYKGLEKILPYVDQILCADKFVYKTFKKYDNPNFSKFKDRIFKINLWETLKNKKFKKRKDLEISSFGQYTYYRNEILQKFIKQNIKYNKFNVDQLKIFDGKFTYDEKGCRYNIIIPQTKNWMYISTGALIRCYEKSMIPLIYNNNNLKLYSPELIKIFSMYDISKIDQHYDICVTKFSSFVKKQIKIATKENKKTFSKLISKKNV